MKKTLSLVLTLLIAATIVSAQGFGKTTELLPKENAKAISSKATILFYEDFDGELPSNWTTVTNAGPCDWYWTMEGGEYGGVLNSTTADNGYMILNSDGDGTGDDEDADLISPAIDCSGIAVGEPVYLYLEHVARTYGYAEIFIYVSTDDFATQTEIYTWGAGAPMHSWNSTTNPLVSLFDIGDIAAGESNVKVKFKWTGAWDYWWLIDDVMVIGGEFDEALITSFDFEEDVVVNVTTVDFDITVTVAVGTDVTMLTPTITVSEGAYILPAPPYAAMDFSAPVEFEVISADGLEWNTYTVTVEIEQVIDTYAVTFNVDMTYAENFVPASDVIYITGNMLGWAEPGTDATNQTMTQVGETMIWTKTLQLEAGTYEYKFFKNAGWEGGEWAGGDNRVVIVADVMTIDHFWGWPLATEINALSNLNVYPNPFSNFIALDNAENVTRVVITNLIGQVVMDMQLSGAERISTSNLSNGVYLVTFQAVNGERVVRKMIKQ
jgi:hypothetical protein